MNKKLKIYSVLFVVVIIVMLVTSVFKFEKTSALGFSEEKLEVTNPPAGFTPIIDTLGNGTESFNLLIRGECCAQKTPGEQRTGIYRQISGRCQQSNLSG